MAQQIGLTARGAARFNIKPVVTCLAALVCAAVATGAGRVGADAVWHPSAAFMSSAHEACDKRMASGFDACFIEMMSQSGAPAPAVDFAKRLVARPNGLVAIVRDFRRTGGPVDVAYVLYPFRANENDAALLVNGTPDIVDIDGPKAIAPPAWKATPAFQALAKRYPNVSVWPGDRSGSAYPRVVARADPSGGQRFVLAYTFRDGCHACAVIGSGEMAFDFDKSGTLAGKSVVSITAKK